MRTFRLVRLLVHAVPASPCSVGVRPAMSLSPHQDRLLRQISDQLAASDPRLARRLSESVQPPTSTLREVVVMAVLLGWAVVGFVPLALGIGSSRPTVEGVGVLTMFIGAPHVDHREVAVGPPPRLRALPPRWPP